MTANRPSVLCVDDEPMLLDAFAMILRRRFEVFTAPHAEAGLAFLRAHGPTAVVVSDMMMPGMDGVAFLRKVRQLVPDAVRILLTGQADVQSTIGAVNEGQIFRFLTKPCPPAALIAAIDAAVEQNRIVTAERVLLEQTLHGCISALTDVLAVSNPTAFGSAIRVRQMVTELADRLSITERWQVEIAAMLSQIGSIAVPPETMEKLHRNQPLTDEEQALVNRIPALTDKFLGSIPRLEAIRSILAASVRPHRQPATTEPGNDIVTRGADLLRAASDLDALTGSGLGAGRAIELMRGRAHCYDPEVLEALAAMSGNDDGEQRVRELPLSELRTGMVLAEDITMISGMILIARGYTVTERFLERARNMRRGVVAEPIRVIG